jgi:hypothetical protein
MSKIRVQSALAVLGTLTLMPISIADASPFMLSVPSLERAGHLSPVDARNYRHCHNINTRVYCHKKDRLPTKSPQMTDGSTRDNSDRPKPRMKWPLYFR